MSPLFSFFISYEMRAPRVSGDEPAEIDGEHGNGLSFLRDSRTFALSAGDFGIVSTNGRMELVKMVA